jgi:hypothetical protein
VSGAVNIGNLVVEEEGAEAVLVTMRVWTARRVAASLFLSMCRHWDSGILVRAPAACFREEMFMRKGRRLLQRELSLRGRIGGLNGDCLLVL